MNIASAVILCTIVGAVGAIILVAAAKFMAVEEDPRIEEVASCLAGANCGGCGYAGEEKHRHCGSNDGEHDIVYTSCNDGNGLIASANDKKQE